jgi:hypothetical protein
LSPSNPCGSDPDPTAEGTDRYQDQRDDASTAVHERCARQSEERRGASRKESPTRLELTREDRDEDQEPAAQREQERHQRPHPGVAQRLAEVDIPRIFDANPHPVHSAVKYRVPRDRGRRVLAELGDVPPDLQAVREAPAVRGGSVAAVAQWFMLVLPSD